MPKRSARQGLTPRADAASQRLGECVSCHTAAANRGLSRREGVLAKASAVRPRAKKGHTHTRTSRADNTHTLRGVRHDTQPHAVTHVSQQHAVRAQAADTSDGTHGAVSAQTLLLRQGRQEQKVCPLTPRRPSFGRTCLPSAFPSQDYTHCTDNKQTLRAPCTVSRATARHSFIHSDTVAQHGTCTHGWHMGSGTHGWALAVSSQNGCPLLCASGRRSLVPVTYTLCTTHVGLLLCPVVFARVVVSLPVPMARRRGDDLAGLPVDACERAFR